MPIRWSHYRDNDARTCLRRVFYKHRFASATARKGSDRFEAYLLKQALDPSAWAGRLVHHVIREHIIPPLSRRQWPDFQTASRRLTELMRRQRDFSRQELFRSLSKNAAGDAFCVLRADLFHEGFEDSELRNVLDTSLTAIRILEENHAAVLRSVQTARRVFSEKSIRFRLDDEISVEMILDVLFFGESPAVTIVDWKVSSLASAQAREQLHTYTYGLLRSGWWPEVEIGSIELIEANLLDGSRTRIPVTEEDLRLVDDRIFSGCEFLEPIFEGSVEGVDPQQFAPASRPGACQHCAVLELCNGTLDKNPRQHELSLEFVSS